MITKRWLRNPAPFLLFPPILRAIFLTRTQRAQIMPVVDSIIMSILPDDGEGIRSHCNDIANSRGRWVTQLDMEHIRIGFGPHVLMSAAAGGARAGRAQQLERVDARVTVAPCDSEFPGLFICGNA